MIRVSGITKTLFEQIGENKRGKKNKEKKNVRCDFGLQRQNDRP